MLPKSRGRAASSASIDQARPLGRGKSDPLAPAAVVMGIIASLALVHLLIREPDDRLGVDSVGIPGASGGDDVIVLFGKAVRKPLRHRHKLLALDAREKREEFVPALAIHMGLAEDPPPLFSLPGR